jgi:hypothetical protein
MKRLSTATSGTLSCNASQTLFIGLTVASLRCTSILARLRISPEGRDKAVSQICLPLRELTEAMIAFKSVILFSRSK